MATPVDLNWKRTKDVWIWFDQIIGNRVTAVRKRDLDIRRVKMPKVPIDYTEGKVLNVLEKE